MMIPDGVLEGRCGYTVHWSDFGDDPDEPERWYENSDAVCCYRPSWDNSSDNRCFWHSETTGKSAEEIRDRYEEEDTNRLDGAKLREVKISESFFQDYLVLFGADLSDSDLSGVTLRGVNLREATLYRTNLEAGYLKYANLESAHFHQSNLANTDMEEANLNSAALVSTDLSGASLRSGDLCEADLRQANLQNAEFWGAELNGAQLEDSDFTDAILRRASLKDAGLENAILTRSDLREADLRGAELYQVQFSNTRVNKQTVFGSTCTYERDGSTANTHDGGHDQSTSVSSLEAATWVYRRLESLHEENAMAEESATFHVRKEEAQRAHHLQQRELGSWMVATANRYLTNHGESVAQLLKASTLLIVLSGILYPLVGGVRDSGTIYQITLAAEVPTVPGLVGAGDAILRGLYFSVITFTTIGYANVAPHGAGSRILVGIESLLGAIFIALFVYVLGRRVAR